MLVTAGYMDPRLDFDDLDVRMDAAKEVFYTYAGTYAPEMLSPQLTQMQEAAEAVSPKKSNPIAEPEVNDHLNIGTFGRIIGGVALQASSSRQDVQLEDYLNPELKKIMQPLEHMTKDDKAWRNIRDEEIAVVPHYTKAWQQVKAGVQKCLNGASTLPAEFKDVGYLLAGLAQA